MSGSFKQCKQIQIKVEGRKAGRLQVIRQQTYLRKKVSHNQVNPETRCCGKKM